MENPLVLAVLEAFETVSNWLGYGVTYMAGFPFQTPARTAAVVGMVMTLIVFKLLIRNYEKPPILKS